MINNKVNLLNLNLEELEEFIISLKEPKFRAKQIFNWIYKQKAISFDQMTNLSKQLKKLLIDNSYLGHLKIITSQESADGTVKYLLELVDGQRIESVFMPYTDGRNSICISTQVGCAMGCSFCATGLEGLSRNLSVAEIIGQILTIEQATGEEITNVVFMGMGEPLANYDNLLKSIEIINSSNALNIGMRRITVSTCGLVPEINRLAKEGLQLTLAISLHAANNQLRSQMMPINKRYPLEELLASCSNYITETGRRISFEYSLVQGVNDSRKDAQGLAKLLSGVLAHVNLIPINPVKGLKYAKPKRDVIDKFKSELIKAGIAVTVRVERGADIDAACGQLQAKEGNR